MEVLDPVEAKSLVSKIDIGTDKTTTHEPVFPTTRRDMCVVPKQFEDELHYKHVVFYLLWKSGTSINHEHLGTSYPSDHPITIDQVIDGKSEIVVHVSGYDWNEVYRRNKQKLGLE